MTSTDPSSPPPPAADEIRARVEEIRARVDAAAEGPWRWNGNTDSGELSLENRHWRLLSTTKVARAADSRRAQENLEFWWEYLSTTDDYCPIHEDERSVAGEKRAAEWLEHAYLHDPGTGEAREDEMLAFFVDGEGLTPLRDQVIYQVARNQGLPDDTPRDHPKVYRADIVGVRNPTAAFIAASRSDVPFLLAEIDRLTAERDGFRDLFDAANATAGRYLTERDQARAFMETVRTARDTWQRRAEKAEAQRDALASELDKAHALIEDVVQQDMRGELGKCQTAPCHVCSVLEILANGIHPSRVVLAELTAHQEADRG